MHYPVGCTVGAFASKIKKDPHLTGLVLNIASVGRPSVNAHSHELLISWRLSIENRDLMSNLRVEDLYPCSGLALALQDRREEEEGKAKQGFFGGQCSGGR